MVQGGFIRGFLNDGTTDYSSHHSVDSIAFGHCEYSFRNLGRPSRIAVRQSSTEFRVTVDGTLCFESSKIKLPLGNVFGITAASAENPDSFEVFKFVTTTDSHTPDIQDPTQPGGQQKVLGDDIHGRTTEQEKPKGDIPAFSDPPEVPASQFTSSSEQFADLHNRLQSMMKHISAANRDNTHFHTQAQSRHDELLNRISRMEASLAELHTLRERMDGIQNDVRQTKADLHGALDGHVQGIKDQVVNTHYNLHKTVEGMGSGLGRIVLVVCGSNALLVGAYLLYKRRKANSPKKYL